MDDYFAAWWWWPLAGVNRPAIASFRESDHLINHTAPGERLVTAFRRLVQERLGLASPPGGRVTLLTNLSYFGYCFNPVSFYYLWGQHGTPQAGEVVAVVAEVTNTPWGEQHCYVLQAGAPGVEAWERRGKGPWRAVAVRAGGGDGRDTEALAPPPVPAAPLPPVVAETSSDAAALAALGAVAPQDFAGLTARFTAAAGGGGAAPDASAGTRSLRFRFAKTFHVSPFMPLDHVYEWVFSTPGEVLLVQNQNNAVADGALMFNSQVRMVRQVMTWWGLAWLLFVAFPLLTLRIQLWIHWEAFVLWSKGISLFPHPTGATSTLTTVIAAVMTPVMAAADGWARLKRLAAPSGGGSAALAAKAPGPAECAGAADGKADDAATRGRAVRAAVA